MIMKLYQGSLADKLEELPRSLASRAKTPPSPERARRTQSQPLSKGQAQTTRTDH
jgi:hypothetical protein